MITSCRFAGEMACVDYFPAEQPQSQPMMAPGQIWLVGSFANRLPPLVLDAIGGADIVLYPAALAALVAQVLPLGIYAEPLPPGEDSDAIVAPRAVRLAGDGWRVVQLVEAGGDWRRRLAATAGKPSPDKPCDPPLLLVETAADRERQQRERPTDLAGFVANLDESDLLTVILGPLSARHPAHSHFFQGSAFTANGLAG